MCGSFLLRKKCLGVHLLAATLCMFVGLAMQLRHLEKTTNGMSWGTNKGVAERKNEANPGFALLVDRFSPRCLLDEI